MIPGARRSAEADEAVEVVLVVLGPVHAVQKIDVFWIPGAGEEEGEDFPAILTEGDDGDDVPDLGDAETAVGGIEGEEATLPVEGPGVAEFREDGGHVGVGDHRAPGRLGRLDRLDWLNWLGRLNRLGRLGGGDKAAEGGDAKDDFFAGAGRERVRQGDKGCELRLHPDGGFAVERGE